MKIKLNMPTDAADTRVSRNDPIYGRTEGWGIPQLVELIEKHIPAREHEEVLVLSTSYFDCRCCSSVLTAIVSVGHEYYGTGMYRIQIGAERKTMEEEHPLQITEDNLFIKVERLEATTIFEKKSLR